MAGDRQLTLTSAGRGLATRVMRKHRLAECLLVSVIGLPWEDVHVEACRWEHVMSEEVERRLVRVLNNPTTSPFGNPIPGLLDLGVGPESGSDEAPLVRLTDVLGAITINNASSYTAVNVDDSADPVAQTVTLDSTYVGSRPHGSTHRPS